MPFLSAELQQKTRAVPFLGEQIKLACFIATVVPGYLFIVRSQKTRCNVLQNKRSLGENASIKHCFCYREELINKYYVLNSFSFSKESIIISLVRLSPHVGASFKEELRVNCSLTAPLKGHPRLISPGKY